MATKAELDAQRRKEEAEFESSFDDDMKVSAEQSDDEAFGITPTMDAESTPDESGGGDALGEPAAVVMEVEPEPEADPLVEAVSAAAESTGGGEGSTAQAAKSEEQALNEKGAADAKAATDEANAKASASAGASSTGVEEAGGDTETVATSAETAPMPDSGVMAEEPMGEPAAGGLNDTSDVPAEDMQKFKSWQGRLKKIEADLKAKADATAAGGAETNGPVADGSNTESQTAEAIDEVAMQAEEGGDTAMADAAASVADQVAAGEMSPAEAMKALAEDFGEPFVKMIEAIARSVAGETANKAVGEVKSATDEIIGYIQDSGERAHFEAIADAHPDFVDISKSESWNAFVAAGGPEAQQIVESGSARQINKLLADFKAKVPAEQAADAAAAQPADEPADGAQEEAMDAAEGVRNGGGGIQLPDEPAVARDDYESAWNES